MKQGRPRILVIRRDNIGDLVCTLPLLQLLRAAWPDAWIGALVTSYNAEVLHDNPHIDAVLTYQKGKHRAPGTSLVGLFWQRALQLLRLRRAGIDIAVLPSEAPQASARRMARLAGARRIVGNDTAPLLDAPAHEAERVVRLLDQLGMPPARPPAARIYPRQDLVARLHRRLDIVHAPLVIGVHISARKPSQRWPIERHAALIDALAASRPGVRCVLFWAPGASDNALHPGDDDKAAAILASCKHLPVVACPTATLAELIAGLSLIDVLVCADGGHMHLAAALGKPIVALFGKSDASRWFPWSVPHRILQTPSQVVDDIAVETVVTALQGLVPVVHERRASVG